MHRVDDTYIREERGQVSNSITDVLQIRTPRFAAMGRNKDDSRAIVRNAFREAIGNGAGFLQVFHRIDHCVARHHYVPCGNTFGQQIAAAQRSGSEMNRSHNGCQSSIYFFRVRVVDVLAAKSSLDMCNWNLVIEGTQCSGKHGCGIALNHQAVQSERRKNGVHCLQ
jgi:hypothetical protein